MQTGFRCSALIEQLRDRLGDYRYTEYKEATLSNTGTMYLIMTPRRWMVRRVCVVLEAPEQISTVNQTKELFEMIRAYLSERYARFPWYKEIGAYVVMLCSHELYEKLDGHLPQFYDRTGFHTTLMLGSIFVDRDECQSSAEETWVSQKRFAVIRDVVRAWCRQHVEAN
jgi:hypothetical protein